MRNKIKIVGLLLTFSSCSIFKTSQTLTEKKINEIATNDKVVTVDIYQKFLGDYNLEIIGIPTGDDGSLTMRVSRDGDLLKTEYTGETIEAASWTVIKSTEVEDDILFVEIFVPEYNITGYWELYVEGNEVTGYAFDRFDIVGTKSN